MRVKFFCFFALLMIFSCQSKGWSRKSFFNLFSIELPGYLNQAVLPDFDGIYYENKSREFYLTIDQGTKSDFESSGVIFNINLVGRLVLSELMKEIPESDYKELISFKVDHFTCVQWQLKGKMTSGFYVHYLLSVLESGNDYFVITIWTAENRWSEYASDASRIIQSFKKFSS